jgi:hypothetical protein
MDSFQYFNALGKAQQAAKDAVPAFYKLNDDIIYQRDSFENSASLYLQHDKAFDELAIMDLPKKLSGLTASLESKLVNIMMSDANVTDKNLKAMMQDQKQKQISAEIKKFEQFVQSSYKRMMESRMERLNADAITNQARRMYGTSLASSEGDSEEKSDSIEEIENSYMVHPDEVIATA